MTTLIYIADPMCSWCYGFAPELSALSEALPALPIEIVLGGLRAYSTETMDAELKATLLTHWQKVAEMTGLSFSDTALAREGFVYNTEPACRAVVAARMLAHDATIHVFHAIQCAFYERGLDVTQGEVLAEVASAALTKAGFPIDASTFLSKWGEEETILATHADFVQAQNWKITGFPTLVLERNGTLDFVTSGYTPMPMLVDLLQRVIDKPA